jgi:predicted AlkP superfamily pyrophosphatase or phosphodiesterase
MNKIILILCDALRDDIAAQNMGFLEHLVEEKRASRYTVIASLPTLSRPLYETIHTGLPAVEHGITSNSIVRRSSVPNLFEVARQHHRTTAAAASYWYSELYIRAPYDIVNDHETDDESQLIQHGRFYREDDFPDAELFATGEMLRVRYQPDYLLVHPMGIDWVGHLYGADSSQYRNQVIVQDQLMSTFIPNALQEGYTVLVTGDHGMSADHQHNGTTPDVRHVPLYIIPSDGNGAGDTHHVVSQLQIAPTVCRLLGVEPAPTMRMSPINQPEG